AQLLARQRDFQPDMPGALEEPVEMLLEAEDLAGIDTDALKDAVAIEQTVIVHADSGIVLVVQLAVDPDARHGRSLQSSARRGEWCGDGASTRPAVRRTTRSVPCAISRLCVTITIVSPSWRFKSCMRPMICLPVSSSRFPVGSSARRTRGSLMR